MAGENPDEAIVQELTEICRELERRGWTGTKIQKWFGGGFNKPFDGVINEVWVDTDEEEPAIMAHIDFEDGDEEDVELAEAPQYVADKKKQKHMLQDLEELINKRKKNKNKRPLDDSASEDNSSAKGGRASSSTGGGGGGGDAKRPKVSKDGKAKEKKSKGKEPAPKKASRGSGSESEKSRGPSKAKRPQKGDAEDGVEEGKAPGVEVNKYVEALQLLFREGRLHAGAKISATLGEASVCAELQEDGQIRQQLDEGEPAVYFVSPEEFAARAFPDANVKELGITIDETPLQRVEDDMLPPLDLPPGLEGALAVDDATARKWVCNMEEALALLELVYDEAAVALRQKKRREASSQANGSANPANGEGEALTNAALLDPSMRAHSRDQLRKLVERVHQFVQAAAPPQDAQLATMAEVDSRVRKAFGLELARLNWVTQSHAKIEKKLASLLEGDETDMGHKEIQEEVAACLGVGLDSLVDRTTPFSMHVAQLADFRFQLRCMLRKAKDLVSVRQNSEERYYRQVIVSYGRQKDIIYGVRSQQKDVEKRRDKESKGLAGRVASIEQEVQLLSEALEAKKEQLEKEKAALLSQRQVYDSTVTLLGEKKERWSGKMEQTRDAQKASRERLLVLKEVNTYLEGMCVEPCIQSQLQHFLNSLCAECCKAWAHKAHNTDARARCRTRLAYEILGLIKRLWGGNVTVVVDMNKISAAFAAVFTTTEVEVSMWQGMPLPLESPLALDGTPNTTLKVLRRQPNGDDAAAPPTFCTEPLQPAKDGAEASTPISEADVRGGLGFKTLLLALAPSDLTTAAIRHADELASQLDSAMDVSSSSSSLSSPRPHHLLLLPTPPSPMLPVPPFLLECLLLSHAQEYLAITARAAKNNTTPQEEASHCEMLDGESMLVGEATLDSDAIKTRPLPHSEPVPLMGGSPTWWEEVTDGRTSSFIPANAFGDAMVAATLVCKAVDAVMIANPSPSAPEPQPQAEAAASGAPVEQEPLVDPSHPSTNALVCLKTLGQQAGRYGAPLKHMTLQEQHVVNYIPVAVMYARIVWGIRRVAVVDVGRSLACGTLNCLSGDHDALFACLHTDPQEEAHDRPDALICSLLRKDTSVAEVVKEVVTDKLCGVMDDFLPELVIVSASLRPEHDRVTVTPEELELVVGEMAKVAQRLCMGRLVVVLDGAAYHLPPPQGKSEADAGGERLGACLRALKASKLDPPTTEPKE